MKCINCSTPLFPLHSQIKHKPQLKTQKFLPLSSTTDARIQLHKGQNMLLPLHSRPKAIASSLVLDLTPPVMAGDMTVLLRTGAGFFFLYWLANFVVPEFVTKELQKQMEERRDIDENPSKNAEGSAPISRKSRPERKKKKLP